MKNKLIDINEVKHMLKDDMTIMIGGFASVGVPETLIDVLVKSEVKNLTLISNDSTHPGYGLSKIIATGQVKKLIASHIGMNPQTGEKYNDGSLEVELVPQGTLAERIRAAGSGLGGVLTQTGLGTEVAEAKDVITVQGKDYLLEYPLKADLALIYASTGDTFGNLIYKGTTQNFNPLMALAADIVVAELEELVEIGKLEPENIRTPGILVDYVVKGEIHG